MNTTPPAEVGVGLRKYAVGRPSEATAAHVSAALVPPQPLKRLTHFPEKPTVVKMRLTQFCSSREAGWGGAPWSLGSDSACGRGTPSRRNNLWKN